MVHRFAHCLHSPAFHYTIAHDISTSRKDEVLVHKEISEAGKKNSPKDSALLQVDFVNGGTRRQTENIVVTGDKFTSYGCRGCLYLLLHWDTGL